MDYTALVLKKEDTVGIITINRPSALNALNTQVLLELEAAVLEMGNDRTIRVVLITGEGRAFVAGADIKEIKDLDLIAFRRFIATGQRVFYCIDRLEKPVIAVVNGLALGGGCELALACDFCLASEKAQFGFPEVKLGIFPGFGGTQRATRFLGRGMASEMTFTGDPVPAQEALRIGLVNHVYPAEALMGEAMKMARAIAERGPIGVARAKTSIKMAGDSTMEAGLAFEREAIVLSFGTEDRKEGMNAFLEKRKPVFSGN
jgi:enoyl-CoA hydratase